MSFTDQAEIDLLDLMFQNVDAVNYGDAAGLQNSAAPGSSELALADVNHGETDTALTANEVAYTGYLRPTQARSSAGWAAAAAGLVDNAALIQFGSMTAGGPDTATSVGLGFFSADEFLHLFGSLDADLVINNGINPQFVIGAFDVSLT